MRGNFYLILKGLVVSHLCDNCGKNDINEDPLFWNCMKCNFDLCSTCFDELNVKFFRKGTFYLKIQEEN